MASEQARGLLGELSRSDPELATSVLALEERLAYRSVLSLEPERPDERPGRRVLLALESAFQRRDFPRVAASVLETSTPPAGIYGGGVVRSENGLQLAVFVMNELLQAAGLANRRMVELPESVELVRYLWALDLGVPDDVVVVGIEHPSEQLAPGEPLSCLGMRGTCGPAVTTPGGNPAVLTAGHVARPVGATVDDAEGRIGRVLWSDSIAQHAAGDVCADAAVVELVGERKLQSGPEIEGAASADQFAQVVAYGQRGPLGAWIRAPIIRSFALTTTQGAWGDVFMTDTAISIGGDSGAPVLLDQSGAVVGLIVAGAGSYSLVQDIDFVLARTGATLVPDPS